MSYVYQLHFMVPTNVFKYHPNSIFYSWHLSRIVTPSPATARHRSALFGATNALLVYSYALWAIPGREEDGKAVLDEPFAGTPFFTDFTDTFDFYGDVPVEIATVQLAAERMPKEVFYIPALLLLVLIVLSQRRRQTVPAF